MNSSVSISSDKQARIDAALLSFACGDALGMATEFMTRDQIERAFPDGVTRLLSQKDSQNHWDLTPGSVTDDTEQVAYLLERYRAKGQVTVADTVDALLVWIRETRAVEKHYIGPSSLKALTAIENGADPATAGTGTTLMPRASASRTMTSPGSETQGIPASEQRAQFSPASMRRRMPSPFCNACS